MSYVVIEPINIKIRRLISKILKRDDQKVIKFDKEAIQAFKISYGDFSDDE